MIVTESLTIKGRAFIKTYSDSGYKVERDGYRYVEAYDPAETNRTYTETDEPIEVEDMTEKEAKATAYDILVGEAK